MAKTRWATLSPEKKAQYQSSPEVKRKSHLKNKYNISVEDYNALYEKQGGLCAICGSDGTDSRGQLVVDHNHDTEVVRGLLCGKCNTGIGMLGDDIENLQAALAYLARRPVDNFVLTNGHPPVAHKVLAVDFDKTLYPTSDLLGYPKPIRGAVAAMRKLKKAGYTLVIFTSRLSETWFEAEGWTRKEAEKIQYEYVRFLLERDGIPFDRITAEKIPAVGYVDDKAIEFTGDNWKEITERLIA